MRLLSAAENGGWQDEEMTRRRDGAKEATATAVDEEEEDEGAIGGTGGAGEGSKGVREETGTMRRRYATEYHYPDNGPAISSAACINLRVKGQDTRYLNK